MQYDLILILTLITSERYLFPSKVVFWGSRFRAHDSTHCR
jgi:hypothetical protein